MARKLKKGKKKTIKATALLDMLREINLGGTIDECSLSVKKGKGYVEVVDITNSVIVIAKKTIASKDVSCELGFGNLNLLISFLGTIEDDKISMKYKDGDDYFMLKRTDGRRKLNYLLTQVDLIATNLSLENEDSDPYKSMKELMEYNVELTPTIIKDFLKYIGMLGSKETTVCFDGEENITFRLGSADDHQFELSLSEEVEGGEEGEEIELVINGEHLAKVFSVINYDEDNPPIMSFAKDKPIMIEGKGISWSLNPLADFEEGG